MHFYITFPKGLGRAMKKETFYFDSRDNKSKIYAVRWTPDSENVVGIVQLVHGMAEHVERYEAFAKYLTEHNFVVTGEDHLGHGKSVGEGGIQGYFCEQDPATVVVRDVHRLKKLTQELYPGVPYFLVGHSMGSFITRNYIYRYGTGINGAVIMGTGFQKDGTLAFAGLLTSLIGAVRGQQHVSRFMDKCAFGNYNKNIQNAKTAFDWLTKDVHVVDAYMADGDCGFTFTVNGFKTLFELISRAQDLDNLAQIPKDLPVLMVSGEDDPVGDYGIGVKKVYQALVDAGVRNVKMTLYPGDRHELLNETDKETVMEDIVEWISNKGLRE